MKPGSKPFSGRRALIWLLVCFGVVVIVNGIMIGLALYSDPERRSAVVSESFAAENSTGQEGLVAKGSRQ